MPGYWVLKSEPSTYAYADLVRDGPLMLFFSGSGLQEDLSATAAALGPATLLLVANDHAEVALGQVSAAGGTRRTPPTGADPRT